VIDQEKSAAYSQGYADGYAAALRKGAQEHASKVVIGMPSTGLRPEEDAEKEFNAKRIEEIRQAMGAYIAAGTEFPREWVIELNRRSRGPGVYMGCDLWEPRA
jgi:hypothetical protein